MHEFSVRKLEPGDAVEDIAPEIIIVALLDDAVVVTKGELCAPEHGSAGKFFKYHGHFPFEEDLVFTLRDGRNIHAQLFATLCQASALCHEVLFACHLLDAVLKDDVLMVIRENVRPIRLALAVIGLRPKSQDIIGT